MREITGFVQHADGRPMSYQYVSNGEEIVRTDYDGRFEIECDPARHAFVFVHRPDGLWNGNWYAEIAHVSANLSFVLEPSRRLPTAREIRVGHITDLHLREDPEGNESTTAAMIESDLRWINDVAPHLDVIIASGDLTNRGDDQSIELLSRVLDLSTIPVMPMYAGHDGLVERRRSDASPPYTTSWERVFGPICYSFDLGGWIFVIYQDENAHGEERAAIYLRWLDRIVALAQGRPVCMVQHRPPDQAWIEKHAAAGVRLSISGHWHTSRLITHAGIPVISTPPLSFGGIDMSARGFRELRLREDLFETTFRTTQLGRPTFSASGRAQLSWRIVADAPLARGHVGSHKGRLYISLSDEEGRGRGGVLCVDQATGNPLWRIGTEHSVRAATHGDERTLVIATQAGEVIAVDRERGEVQWRAQLHGYPFRWIHNAPQIGEGVAVVGTGSGGAEGLDLQSGERRWSWIWENYDPDRLNDAWPMYFLPVGTEHGVLCFTHNKGVALLDPQSGEAKWAVHSRYFYIYPIAVLADGALVVPDRPDPEADEAGLPFHFVDLASGEVRRTLLLDAPSATGMAVDDDLFVVSSNSNRYRTDGGGQLIGFDAKSGERRWQLPYATAITDMISYGRGEAASIAPPLLDEQYVYAAGLDGIVRRVDRGTGESAGEVHLGETITSTTMIAPGQLVVSTYPGSVLCLQFT